jgi:NAD(P)H-dependent flavin oxidoreductase YrpB (nitropropane dioxygenase family)
LTTKVNLSVPVGDIEAFPLWSGQAVDLVLRQQPAAEIIREIAEEAEATLNRLADGM